VRRLINELRRQISGDSSSGEFRYSDFTSVEAAERYRSLCSQAAEILASNERLLAEALPPVEPPELGYVRCYATTQEAEADPLCPHEWLDAFPDTNNQGSICRLCRAVGPAELSA